MTIDYNARSFSKPKGAPRKQVPVFNPDGRLMETYRDFRGQTKWRDADIHKDAQQYRQSRIAGYKANAAQNDLQAIRDKTMARFAPQLTQANANKEFFEANRDMINARFPARDNYNKPPPGRFTNMGNNQQVRSMGIGSAGMLDTPPGVKPLLSNQRPAELGNPDFVGPPKPGTGWQDRGSGPYQRIMEHKNMLNDPNEKFGPEAYMQNRMNVEDRQSGSAVVYRPEKGSVMRIDPIKKYAGETGTLAEREQFRQAGDLRTAAINQAKENQYEKWAREDSQEKLKADAEKYKIDMVTKGKTDAALTKVQSEKQKRITDMMLEMKDNIAFKEEIQATKDQLRTAYKAKKQKVSELQLETQALRSIAMRYEGQTPGTDNKSAGNKKTGKDKPDNSLASSRQGARDKALNDTSNSGGDFMDRFRNPVLNNRDHERAWNQMYARKKKAQPNPEMRDLAMSEVLWPFMQGGRYLEDFLNLSKGGRERFINPLL